MKTAPREPGVSREVRIGTKEDGDPVLWNREQKIARPPTKCTWSIYCDGSLTPTRPLRGLVENMWLKNHSMALFKHPHRNCAYDEIAACVNRHKITKKQGLAATQILKERKFPEDFGLWACGVIVRRNPSLIQESLAKMWMSYVKGIPRDQIWFPLCVWTMALKDQIHTIDADIFDNPYFTFRPHGS